MLHDFEQKSIFSFGRTDGRAEGPACLGVLLQAWVQRWAWISFVCMHINKTKNRIKISKIHVANKLVALGSRLIKCVFYRGQDSWNFSRMGPRLIANARSSGRSRSRANVRASARAMERATDRSSNRRSNKQVIERTTDWIRKRWS